MNPRPALPRARLIELPAGTELLREVRYMRPEQFDDLTVEELERGVRWLRAASYSAAEGARRLEAVIRKRNEQDPTPCTSDPATTETPTTTAAPPTATPPPPAPRSPSNRRTKAPE